MKYYMNLAGKPFRKQQDGHGNVILICLLLVRELG